MKQADLGWVEVRVVVPIGWHELVAGALNREPLTSVAFGCTSIGMEPAPEGTDYVRSFYAAKFDGATLRDEITRDLTNLAESVGVEELQDLAMTFRPLPAEDYAQSWKKTWKPFRVGHLCVVPSWFHEQLRETDHRLLLEPGGSFGSGRHATTRTCLKILQERIEGGEQVLDCGTGSGILAVTAVLLGAERAFGFDIDDASGDYALALAADNELDEQCEFVKGGFETVADQSGCWDVVLANIYSDVIQFYAGRIAELLKRDGWFAFSGCPEHHRAATQAAIGEAGLVIEEVRTRGRWTTFVGSRQ